MNSGAAMLGGHRRVSASRAMLSSRTFTPGSPRTPANRPSVCSSIERAHARSSGRPRTFATRCAWMRALAGEICGSTPEADVVDRVGGDVVRPQARVVGPLAREVVEHEARWLLRASVAWLGPRLLKNVASGA